MKRIVITILLLLGVLRVALWAQQPVVSVEMDSTYVTFGCPMTFHLQAIVPEGQTLLFPQEPMRNGGVVAYDDSLRFLLELDDSEPLHVDTVQQQNGMLTLRQDVTVFAFDSATLLIPPFHFVTDSGDTLRTNSLALKVFVPFDNIEVDAEKYCDIKDVQTPDFVIWDYLGWFLWPLLALALIIGGWYGYRYWRTHRSQEEKPVVKAKPLPAHVVAMQALESLAAKQLWQNGRDKLFHTELTDILRVYIEQRFQVPAMERTSDEILDSLYELAESQKSSLANLKQILGLADLVKFAKYLPMADENQLSFVNARMFVEQTKLVEVTEPALEASADDTNL